MPKFPSKEWCEEAVRLTNADHEAAAAGQGWTGDFGAVVDPEPGKLATAFVVHILPKNGRHREAAGAGRSGRPGRVRARLRGPGPVLGMEGAAAGAPWIRWRRCSSAASRCKGDLQPLIERMRYKGIADRVFAQLKTEFIDER